MASYLSKVSGSTPLSSIRDTAISVGVLYRRGFLRPSGLVGGVHAFRIARSHGALVAAFAPSLRQKPDAPAIVDERGAMSYREIDRQSNALARYLRRAGVGDGGVVAVLCRDHRGLVLSMLAAGKAGARLVLMNTGFGGPQLADVVNREGVSLIVHDSEFSGLASHLPARVERLLAWIDPGEEPVHPTMSIDRIVSSLPTVPLAKRGRPGGLVLLTSGTTGTPKGAPRERVSPLMSAQLLHRIPLTRGGAMVIAAPCFHGTGLSQMMLGVAMGKLLVFQQRKFDPVLTLENIQRYRANTLVVVPTMLRRIVDLGAAEIAKHDHSSLRVLFTAGSALSPDLARRTRAIFGPVLYNLYGSTEVAVATVATPEDLEREPGCAGRPPVGCTVALYDAQRKQITAVNTRGAIFVSSGLSFSAYTDGRVKECVDGLLCTGDMGHFTSDRLLVVEGREDDMIVSGGENVYPQEIENLLLARDDVRDAAIVGVDDPEFGKRLYAFVVRSSSENHGEDQDLADEIKKYIRANLARYKVPRAVRFVTEFPRNSTGKLLRSELVRMAGEPENSSQVRREIES
ncbi:AMP-binding protein [Mycobacteroides chelonae]|uniref:AMP-binding protein n=1 Tax=Mycobacteroides chelonae TaxID=1774 RepID=UPI0039E762D8